MKNQYAERTITCAGCGNTVTKRMPPGRKYCSTKCSGSSGHPERKTGEVKRCEVCGVDVYITQTRLGLKQYFCSIEHQIEWQGRNKTKHTCTICSKVFRWSPSRQKNNNIKYCSLECRDADPKRRAMLLEMNAGQQRGHQTNIETIGYGLLESLGVQHLRQHVIGGKFCVDAFIPGSGVIIQFDGDYWHGNPLLFPEPDSRQRKRMRLDQSQDAYMRACGYSVIRVWGSDLERRPGKVLALIAKHIDPPG